MKLVIAFDRPLGTADRTELRICLGTLAKCGRIVIEPGGRSVRVMGEAMSTEAVAAALAEAGLEAASITSSLDADDDALADDSERHGERFRPLGR